MIELKRILLPTDFSDHSRQATAYACELAQRFGAELHVLHVLEPLTMVVPSTGAPLPDVLLVDREKHAQEHLQGWPPDAIGSDLPVTRCLKTGQAFVEVILYAREHEMDLIVLGTHGRTGLTHALIGSVAERVVRKAPCPVLTVRSEGHQFVSP